MSEKSQKQKKLFLLFIDGIGMAEKSTDNPISALFERETDGFGIQSLETAALFSSSVLNPIDATLGIKGEPQSATGQTSIFTGVNAAEFLGYHLPAFPNEELLEIIMEKSLMKRLKEEGVSVTSTNMYSENFFEDREQSEKNRFPVSTLTIKASDSFFRMEEHYKAGKAVFADITNELIRKRGYDLNLISPEEAGERILAIMEDTEFVFFEYFMTDHYGHKRKRAELDSTVQILNSFVTTIARGLDREREALLIISDHGNAEDMKTGGHTKNPVPGLLISENTTIRSRFTQCRNLMDIYNFVLDYYKI